MKIVRSLLLLLAAALAASGVHAAKGSIPIQNFEELPVSSGDGKALTLDQVKNAIISGGSRNRWVATVQSGNVVRLTYSARTHVAVVNVAYNTKTYSIRYADSTNLGYSPEGAGVIHPNYNKWVSNLRRDIESALRSAN